MSSVEPGSTEVEEPVEEAPAPPPDPYESDLQALKTELGDALVQSGAQRGDLWVRVHRDAWDHAAEVLRNQLGYDYFCFLSAVDWMPPTWPNPKVIEAEGVEAEEAEPEPPPSTETKSGFAGGDSRFQVLARVYSTTRHQGVFVKADLDDDTPEVMTWSRVYRGADWHERETHEMYGIGFTGHPYLANLYLPGAFEGYPLRKDFPLLSREVKPWPGLVDVEQFPASYKDPNETPAATEDGATEENAGADA